MIGVIGMAARHAGFTWGRSALLAAAIAVVVALPVGGRTLVSELETRLRGRAETVPLLVGATGSRFDLVFTALHFRVGGGGGEGNAAGVGTIPMRTFDALAREPESAALPIHARFTARGEPVVATTIDYLERRGLRPQAGRVFAGMGEAVVGARAAERLGLGPGDELPSDQLRSYDLTSPNAILLSVVGVLGPTRTPDDDAVFVDLSSAWLLEGIAHGHRAAERVDEQRLLARGRDHLALSGSVIEYQRVTPENAAGFHVHGDRADLPLTAVLLFPENERRATIVRTRVNNTPGTQAVEPAAVVDELMAFVVRMRAVVDGVTAFLGAATLALVGLIAALTWRQRSDEIALLREVGAGRGQILVLLGAELALVLGVGVALALGLAAAGASASGAVIGYFIG